MCRYYKHSVQYARFLITVPIVFTAQTVKGLMGFELCLIRPFVILLKQGPIPRGDKI